MNTSRFLCYHWTALSWISYRLFEKEKLFGSEHLGRSIPASTRTDCWISEGMTKRSYYARVSYKLTKRCDRYFRAYAGNAGNVSPIDDIPDMSQLLTGPPDPPKQESRSNIPMMRRERRKNSDAARLHFLSHAGMCTGVAEVDCSATSALFDDLERAARGATIRGRH